MKIVGATELAMVLYRDKLPKFRNAWHVDEFGKKMITPDVMSLEGMV